MYEYDWILSNGFKNPKYFKLSTSLLFIAAGIVKLPTWFDNQAQKSVAQILFGPDE